MCGTVQSGKILPTIQKNCKLVEYVKFVICYTKHVLHWLCFLYFSKNCCFGKLKKKNFCWHILTAVVINEIRGVYKTVYSFHVNVEQCLVIDYFSCRGVYITDSILGIHQVQVIIVIIHRGQRKFRFFDFSRNCELKGYVKEPNISIYFFFPPITHW